MAVKLILDKTLSEKGITRYELAKHTDTSYQIIDNYYKNKVTRYDSFLLDKICKYLDCEISDLIVYEK